jgi:hypothetical protein
MQTMPIASNGLAAKEAGIFNQIAMFSVTGLAMSLALVVVFGLRMISPWF